MRAFAKNEGRIRDVAARNPAATFEHGQFGDWTQDEFRALSGHKHTVDSAAAAAVAAAALPQAAKQSSCTQLNLKLHRLY